MPNLITERIYKVTGGQLFPRDGAVTVDDMKNFYLSDTDGPVHVVDGLLKSDAVVMLCEPDTATETSDATGFLVTQVGADGSGIIMKGDLIESSPKLWVNEYLRKLWDPLYGDGYSFLDFGLSALDTYYKNLLVSKAKLP